jgi:hypothetical protein
LDRFWSHDSLQMTSAALQSLRSMRRHDEDGDADRYAQMENYYRRRLALLEKGSKEEPGAAAEEAAQLRLITQNLRNVERSVVLHLRDQDKIHDEVARALERELDLLDASDATRDV